ncbi:PREDICTED: cytochrome P450 71B12-like [Tarenaya hassleriana]|uniref:cytochrome P450 71B12-like n=1 Tax=Tarenaya hassleriana TaxID=28532 RepID=UPI00053C0FE5|nr:PREDICTED: cytochrome P450 71B12-like [Tarenaya hassleriana]
MSYWLVLVCIVSALILIARKTGKRGNRPPGPPALPIIGNLHQLGLKPHRSLFELSKKYGPIMYLKLGSVPTVVVSSPETVKEVLKTYDVECCTRPHLACPAKLTYNYSDLAFSPYNEYWRELRKMSTLELYTAKRVHSFRYIRGEEVASLIDFVKESGLSGTPVNFNRKMMSLSGSVICRIGFGMNLRGSKLGEKYEEVVLQAMKLLGDFPATDFFPYFGWIIDRITGLQRNCGKIFQELDAFYEQAIKLHLENESRDGEEDIIDSLLKMEKQELGLGQFQLTRNHIKGILVNILLAGIDTSAQTVTWAMTHLITNPRIMKRVQTELRERIKNKDSITEEDMENLDYLKMVVKETLRINPVAPLLIPREAMKDVKINGYDVPKKTRIQVNIWAIHRNPEVWKDPERFIPERFKDSQMDYKGQNFELLPFGSGRRVCPGMGIGMALVHLTLMNLLYRFDWKLPEGMKIEEVDLEEAYGLVTPKMIPLQLVPISTPWT